MKRVSTKLADEKEKYFDPVDGTRKAVWIRDMRICQYPEIVADREGYGLKNLRYVPCGSNFLVSPHHILGRRGPRLNDMRFIVLLDQKHHQLVQGIRREKKKLLEWQITRGLLRKEDLPEEWKRELSG